MQGDFSLDPLAYRDAVSRVLIQQGRVQLDSDANEQTESLLRFLRGLAFDLIGAHGGVGDSFDLKIPDPAKTDLLIGFGWYYVDGIRSRNAPAGVSLWEILSGTSRPGDGVPYNAQPYYFAPDGGDWTKASNDPAILFYLDVFERHISASQDETLREVALLGPDTASRAVVVWQVRATGAAPFQRRLEGLQALAGAAGANKLVLPATWDLPYVALNLVLRSGVRMRAQAIETEATDPCTISPDARYRGTENRLFRVEIHDPSGPDPKKPPTFKWSADNASIVYAVSKVDGATVHLDSFGLDDQTTIRVNDWVEVVDDQVLLMGQANPLLQVLDVRPADMTVILSDAPQGTAGSRADLHPILRRWATAPVPLREGTTARDAWFDLADGVEVQFSHGKIPDAGYRTGDYWLIPARTATGDVIWPKESDGKTPAAVPPHGVDHHYAPLALWQRETKALTDMRRTFNPLAQVP